jgi:hypothetical protein
MVSKSEKGGSKRSKSARKPPASKQHAFEIAVEKGQTNAEAVAAKLIGPVNRHANLAPLFGGFIASGLPDEDKPGVLEYALELRSRAAKVGTGDLSQASDALFMQALTLDGIFTETARRAANNIEGGYLPAYEIFMRLALKAQTQSRATLEALAKLHQPREQTVRHVHVNEGGQAIVADEFHNHTGGQKNGRPDEQPHATGGARSGTALPSSDPIREAMPSAGGKRQPAMQNARRQRKRRSEG